MKYYRVKPQFDRQPLYKPSQKRHIPNGYSLIRHQLFTEKEKMRLNVPDVCVEVIECSPSETYSMFGARFQSGAFSRE